MKFKDRMDAGRRLGAMLEPWANRADVVVLGLPRGGVPVAFEVARRLHAPLDVFVVRKLGVPDHEELAMGAIASGGACVMNLDVVHEMRISEETIQKVEASERAEMARREMDYRDDRPLLELLDRTVILVDDGLATGATMRAAVAALRRHGPSVVIVAVPVASVETCDLIRADADEVICVATPQDFRAVDEAYEDFSQTTDAEVRALLAQAMHERLVA